MAEYVNLAETLRFCATNGDCHDCPCEFPCDGTMGEGLYVRAADAIEELLAKDTNVPNKWISVEERLPEDSGYAIVFCADGNLRHVTFAKYLKTPKRWELSGARSYWRVLNWMPLPEPPKGD